MIFFIRRGYWRELIESIICAHNKLKVVPKSLAQLVGTIAFYMQESGFDPWTLHLFTLWVDFQAIRLP
jgi:hypothetical protein